MDEDFVANGAQVLVSRNRGGEHHLNRNRYLADEQLHDFRIAHTCLFGTRQDKYNELHFGVDFLFYHALPTFEVVVSPFDFEHGWGSRFELELVKALFNGTQELVGFPRCPLGVENSPYVHRFLGVHFILDVSVEFHGIVHKWWTNSIYHAFSLFG